MLTGVLFKALITGKLPRSNVNRNQNLEWKRIMYEFLHQQTWQNYQNQCLNQAFHQEKLMRTWLNSPRKVLRNQNSSEISLQLTSTNENRSQHLTISQRVSISLSKKSKKNIFQRKYWFKNKWNRNNFKNAHSHHKYKNLNDLKLKTLNNKIKI